MATKLIGGSVLYRDLKRVYPIIARAEGIYLYDESGKRYIDGSGGSSAVTSIGHAVPEVVRAMAEQAARVAFVPMHLFTHRPAIELADLIASLAPGTLNRVWFASGGSEATENAVKLARQYHVERGQPGKFLVISRWQSFHGATLAALGYGGHTYRRRKYAPLFHDAPKIPPAYRYRCDYCADRPACTLACADALEKEVRRQGPENVAAFIAEPVVGAALGAVPAPDGYFERIRAICDRYDLLFIADEVMTGFGRTGTNFAIEHWGVVPDLIATAKGVSGGYTPLGAVIAKDEVIEVFERKGANFVAGHTYVANPLSCAVGLAVLRYILDHDLVANARVQGARLLEGCARLQKHAIVGDVRGKGLMVGLEFVRDRATREPFPPELEVAKQVALAALERGLVTYPLQGCAEGVAGDMLKLTPPLVVQPDQVDEIIAILDEAIAAVARRLP